LEAKQKEIARGLAAKRSFYEEEKPKDKPITLKDLNSL
jgi:hypothetical protein